MVPPDDLGVIDLEPPPRPPPPTDVELADGWGKTKCISINDKNINYAKFRNLQHILNKKFSIQKSKVMIILSYTLKIYTYVCESERNQFI